MQTRLRANPIRSTRELQTAYDTLYKHGELVLLPSFYLWAFSLLSPKPGARFLDISCGRGMELQVAQGHGVRAYGVDLSGAAVQEANTRLGATFAVVADAEYLPFADGAFEFVTNLGSIEHYLHPENGVTEIARVLSADGKACILLPNSYSLLENVWRVLITGDVADLGQPVERYATRGEWERMLSGNGLSIYRTVRYNHPFPRTLSDWCWYMQHPRKLLWLLASLFVPLNLSGCFAFLCCKSNKHKEG